jgi:hypothetical protein
MSGIRLCAVLCLVLVSSVDRAAAQEAPRTPQLQIESHGAITNITIAGDSWSGVIKKVQALRQVPRDQDASVVATLTKDLDSLPPPYIYELVRRTCHASPEKAAYLFALAGSRMRYDALRCVDQSAKPGVQATLYSLQMPECKEMLSNMELNLSSLRQVRDAKELFSSKVSPWWICSHGMRAIMAAADKKALAPSDWLKSESEWSAMQKEVRDIIDYTLDKHSKK